MPHGRYRIPRVSFLLLLLGTLLRPAVSAQPASGWVLRESGTGANLWGVAQGVLPDSTRMMVAVGEQGSIVTSRDEGVTWSRQQSGTTAWLTSVEFFHFGAGPRFIAVGEGGVILASSDGATWTRETSPTSVRLNAVREGRVSGTAYAFGEAGAGWLIRDLNGMWSRQEASFSSRWIRGTAFDTIVGERGSVFEADVDALEPNGQPRWRPVPVGVEVDLEAMVRAPSLITGGPASTLVAVGADGTIVQRTVAGDWVQRSSGTTQRLRGVAVKSPGSVTILTNTLRLEFGELFAVGTNGTMLRSADGAMWQADTVPTQRNLNAIATVPDAVIAVGDAGTILRLDRTMGGPVIVRQPSAGYDDQGRAFFAGEVTGNGQLTYLWVQLRPGAPLFVAAGGPRLLVPQPPPLAVPAPVYQLIVGNAFGITRSDPIVPPKVANFSVLGFAGGGDATMIGGFSVSTLTSAEAARVLIRAIGPGLRQFGVASPLNAPTLSLYAADRLLDTKAAWTSGADAAEIRAAAARSGAFPLADDSRDAAMLVRLGAGNYTVVVNDVNGGSGSVLLELYDVDGQPFSRLANFAVRSTVRTGEHPTIGGFVVTAGLRKSMLMRVAGPALRQFQLPDALTQPRFVVRRSAETMASGGAWSAGPNVAPIRRAQLAVQAFPFAEGSADAGLLMEFGAGAYTIEVTDAAQGRGVALLEMYEL